MSFIRRLFGKSKPSAKERPPINEDWRVGDLAVALTNRFMPAGRVCRVSRVMLGVIVDRPDGPVLREGWGLAFADFAPLPGFHGYPADCFRKPIADNTVAEEEFTALIKRRTPVEA